MANHQLPEWEFPTDKDILSFIENSPELDKPKLLDFATSLGILSPKAADKSDVAAEIATIDHAYGTLERLLSQTNSTNPDTGGRTSKSIEGESFSKISSETDEIVKRFQDKENLKSHPAAIEVIEQGDSKEVKITYTKITTSKTALLAHTEESATIRITESNGKVCIIYPPGDEKATKLAEEIVEKQKGKSTTKTTEIAHALFKSPGQIKTFFQDVIKGRDITKVERITMSPPDDTNAQEEITAAQFSTRGTSKILEDPKIVELESKGFSIKELHWEETVKSTKATHKIIAGFSKKELFTCQIKIDGRDPETNEKKKLTPATAEEMELNLINSAYSALK